MSEQEDCPFCRIIAGEAPRDLVYEDEDSIVIVPIGPITEGHVLVIPREHVADVSSSPTASARTVTTTANYLREFSVGPCNVITSKGVEATQSVFHFHAHVVPRSEGDGLALPWQSHRPHYNFN